VSTHRFEAAGLGKAPFTYEGFQVSKWQACPGAPVQAGSSCDYCGQSIMLVFAIRSADGRRFKVGCDCVAKVGDEGLLSAVKRAQRSHQGELRKARAERARDTKRLARADAARLRRRQARRKACAFARAHGLIPALRVALRGPRRAIAKELLGKLVAFGGLSPAQTAFLKQLGTRLAPAPTGRVTFAGVIEAVKPRDFGPIKMTVLADGGFRVWMTCPRSVLSEPLRMRAGEDTSLARFRGRRVTVTATLSPSGETGFAFGKRPTARLEPASTG
jgi:hypothetical protein